MEKKKIAFVIHSMSSGGAERVVSILSNSLSSSFEIFIITITGTPSFYELDKAITLIYCTKELKPSKNFIQAVASNFKIFRSISNILKQRRIDLCIGFMTVNNVLATLSSKRRGIPAIISERNNPYLQSASVSFFWRGLRRLVYPFADLLVLQTQRVKTFYTPFIEKSKLVTIPNPINPNFGNTETVEKKNIILNVGSLEHQKGQEVLIRAFSQSSLKGWQLHIAGEGKLRSKLVDLISELGLEKRIKLLGKQPNIGRHYASCKIFAFSSRYEGFPNALLEAMYMGLPCISTDCHTGPSEMIEDGLNGFLVPVDDVSALSLKLEKLTANETLRNTLGHAARKSVEKYRTEPIVDIWKQQIDGLLTLYNS